ncbi:MAG: phospholipase D family protein [Sedimentibacter sp.]
MLYIQDPDYTNSILLHDELLNIIEKAVYGIGTYAFVTNEGLQLLVESDTFERFISKDNSKFTLLMGIDEVTNTRTLEKARVLMKKHSNLSIKVFYDKNSNNTYHPKYSFFKTNQGGSLIIGSGNLTLKGLRKNREAFTITEVNNVDFSRIEFEWEAWLSENDEYIKEIDDEEVIMKADENARRRQNKIQTRKKKSEFKGRLEEQIDSSEDEIDAWEFETNSRVLAAEIPKNRWGQAGFHKETIRDFYKVNIESFRETLVILRKILPDGTANEIENRIIKYKKASKNYYFEITTPENSAYPESGQRPVIIFVEIALRTYLYMLLMPEDENYSELSDYLISNRAGDKCAQEIINVETLKSISPKLRLLEYFDKYVELQ